MRSTVDVNGILGKRPTTSNEIKGHPGGGEFLTKQDSSLEKFFTEQGGWKLVTYLNHWP